LRLPNASPIVDEGRHEPPPLRRRVRGLSTFVRTLASPIIPSLVLRPRDGDFRKSEVQVAEVVHVLNFIIAERRARGSENRLVERLHVA
jgi:hypothetical protein